MQAIELETTISRLGHIDLPEDCREAFGRSARIILLLDEPPQPTEDQRRERLRAALDGLAASGAFADPDEWQREAADLKDALEAFSKGAISKENAIRMAELRDYSELLLALGRHGLPLPTLPEAELQAMTCDFVEILEENHA
jgi:hypothetical protein